MKKYCYYCDGPIEPGEELKLKNGKYAHEYCQRTREWMAGKGERPPITTIIEGRKP